MSTEFNGFVVESRTFVTGDMPSQAFGIQGGRKDFDSAALRGLWAGCIDAVEFIPNGKMHLVEFEYAIVPGSTNR